MDSTGVAQLSGDLQIASDGNYWVYLIGAIVVAIVSFYFAFRYYKRARVVEDTPTSKIRSAAQGYVELKGHGALMEGPEILGPYSRKVCTWYSYKVEKLGEKHTRIMESGASDELFVLEGETGRCVIDPDGAHVTPTVKQVWYASSYPPNRLSQSGSFFGQLGSRYRYTERRMHPGDPLYAIGWFKSVGGQAEAFNTREEVRELIANWKKDPNIVRKFDTNNDGQLDMQEWDELRRTAQHEVRKNQVKRSTKPPTHVMTKPEDRNHPFLLSSIPQHQLTKRFRLYAAGCFALFLASGGFSVYLFNIRF